MEILISIGVAETRIAVVEDGRVEALTRARHLGAGGMITDGVRSLVGDIILGRVVRVLPGIQAAFVDIGHDRAGFLGAHEARNLTGANDALVDPAISDLVREGEAVLVQVTKDPIGEKGARLTTSVSLPGRLCVLTPYQPGLGISRRIDSELERLRLQGLGEALLADASGDLMARAGYIFRTATVGATLEDLRSDATDLAETWRAILEARAAATPPQTLYRDLGPVERALRDLVRETTARILIDDAKAAEAARTYCRRAMPSVEARIEEFAGPGELFDLYDIEAAIDTLTQPRVALPCGGWITIERTEALTAIDVNSGSYTAAADLEDTGFAVNREAAREIARQIRLRAIGGMIVVDFIHTKEPSHADDVLQELMRGLTKDGTPVTVAPATEFGLVEITRKRVREPLDEQLMEECPQCAGLGLIRRPDAVAMDVLRRVEAAARAEPGKTIRVHASPAVIRWLEALGRDLYAALAHRGIFNVELSAEPGYARERFDVSTDR